MGNKLRSWLRTVVPGLWSAGVAWLASLGLPEPVLTFASGLGRIVAVPVALAAVYAGLRWLEGRVPSWLAVVLLGSARPPSYAKHQPNLDDAARALDGLADMGRAAEQYAAMLRDKRMR